MRLMAALFVTICLCGACLRVADSDQNGARREAMRELIANIRDETITEGGFRDLEIGDTKMASIAKLKAFRVGQISVDGDVVSVKKREDLHKLRKYSALLIGTGWARIYFDGNRIKKFETPWISRDWQRRLSEAETKDQAFDILSHFLATEPEPQNLVRNYYPESGGIRLKNISRLDGIRIERFDYWNGSFHDSEGFWNLSLVFSSGMLKSIRILYSPVELP